MHWRRKIIFNAPISLVTKKLTGGIEKEEALYFDLSLMRAVIYGRSWRTNQSLKEIFLNPTQLFSSPNSTNLLR